MDSFLSRLEEFNRDWVNLQEKHYHFVQSTDKLREEEALCVKAVKHCRNYMKFLKKEIDSLRDSVSVSGDDKHRLDRALLSIQRKEYLIRDIEDVLPRTPGLYLQVVLGALNISLANKQDKFRYKNDYEQFKIVVSGISAILAFLFYFFFQSRILDTMFHFLLVWYYCTLTIRERILIANGSRIKGWWNIYHFIATASAGIMLIWPRSESYDAFRDQFMLYSLYLNIVHCIQYQYQIGCLYKLRTLGCRHPMDITVDGFMSWMYRRLGFLLPFLFVVYMFQLYNAYFLYQIAKQDYCHEWQVMAVSLLYFILAMGSIITVLHVIRQKVCAPPSIIIDEHLRKKYSFGLSSDLKHEDIDSKNNIHDGENKDSN